ncbi:MAG: taurine ABC transporter permease, partial [Hyphomicrobiales bacterium]|nr:taurine ABC transporter permease [Hyphomicrobiales bacterium]
MPALSIGRIFGRVGYVGWVSILTSIALVLLWQLAATIEVVPAMFLPSPVAVAAKFVAVATDGFQDATLLQHLLASVGRVTAALIAAIIIGVALGFAMNLSETARGAITPILEFYRPIPPLAYLPLVIIWFGIGE